jgi:hypothetical protein
MNELGDIERIIFADPRTREGGARCVIERIEVVNQRSEVVLATGRIYIVERRTKPA